MNIIKKYFTELNPDQIEQFEYLYNLYLEWNSKINLISRKDIDSLYEKHILHSLGIAKIIQFMPGTKILDIGTGGGFPGIPLAILFPESEFLLIDSIGKKIKVVEGIAKALNLSQLRYKQARAETIQEKFDFIVSRAVTQMPVFVPWTKGKFLEENKNSLENGILYLKGGDLTEELSNFPRAQVYELKSFFQEEFFHTKKVVYLSKTNTK